MAFRCQMLLVVTYSLKSPPRPSVLATRRHPRKLWSVTSVLLLYWISLHQPQTQARYSCLRPTHLGWAAHGIQASSLQASSPQLADEDLDFCPLSKHCFLVLPKATPEPLWHHHSPQIVRRAHVSNLPEPTFMVKLPWGALGYRPPWTWPPEARERRSISE